MDGQVGRALKDDPLSVWLRIQDGVVSVADDQRFGLTSSVHHGNGGKGIF